MGFFNGTIGMSAGEPGATPEDKLLPSQYAMERTAVNRPVSLLDAQASHISPARSIVV